ncbi:MAG: thermonuclease family protein [Sandaracinaceae bacterium]|nr:thermonuclease family protein [Sandaracinaceae bacterium]
MSVTDGTALCAVLGALALVACVPATDGSACGPTRAVVARVIDGDTVELEGGERVRYLLVDTPENTSSVECFGAEATAFNRALVEGREVRLTYDVACTDRFDRLLAYVEVDGRVVNQLLVEQGYACVLHIPPNGEELAPLYEDLETRAVDEGRGLWSVCADNPC